MTTLLHMLPLGSAWLQWHDGQAGEIVCTSLSKNTANIAIVGEGRGKTALSFQMAVSMATDNHHVMFIRPHVLSHLPLPVHGMPIPEASALQLVKLWYPERADEIISWCARIHMQSVLPEVIIIDDFDTYVSHSQSPEHEAARLTASLVDAAAWIASKSGQCPLIFTASHHVTSLPSVLRQFHFTLLELKRSGNDVDTNSFHLRCPLPSTSSMTSLVADYTVSEQNIMLKTVQTVLR